MACHEQKAEQWLATFQATPRTGKLMSLDEPAFVVGKVGPSRGYSPKGKPIVQRHNPQARKMFSLLVCLEGTTPRPVHWVLVEGAITGPRFQEFLATMPANLQGNTLILDNAAIHHASKSLTVQGIPTIAETARGRNIQLAYIPPYSPRCNPTTLFFASLKKRVNKVTSMTSRCLQTAVNGIMSNQQWDVSSMFRHCFRLT